MEMQQPKIPQEPQKPRERTQSEMLRDLERLEALEGDVDSPVTESAEQKWESEVRLVLESLSIPASEAMNRVEDVRSRVSEETKFQVGRILQALAKKERDQRRRPIGM